MGGCGCFVAMSALWLQGLPPHHCRRLQGDKDLSVIDAVEGRRVYSRAICNVGFTVLAALQSKDHPKKSTTA